MEHPLKHVRARRWRYTLIALALICSAAFVHLSIFNWADLQLHDWLTRSLPQKPPPPQVTLIDIDERSLSELGPWPWPRPVTARLMQTLREKGARLQVWDMYFADATPGDASLAAQLKAAQSPTEKIAAIDSLKKITGKLAPRAKNEIAKFQADSPSP